MPEQPRNRQKTRVKSQRPQVEVGVIITREQHVLLLRRSMILGDQDLETFKAKLQTYRQMDLR